MPPHTNPSRALKKNVSTAGRSTPQQEMSTTKSTNVHATGSRGQQDLACVTSLCHPQGKAPHGTGAGELGLRIKHNK